MSTVVHEWGVRPIVTLVSEFYTWETQCHGTNTQTFKGAIQNILKLQVEFKYKRPYGGTAQYKVRIDRKIGDDWYPAITDQVCYCIFDPRDYNWHSEYKEYELSIAFPLFVIKDLKLDFRIITQIEGPGYLPTGSGPGIYGFWSDAVISEFTATFEKPSFELVEAQVRIMEESLRESLLEYKKRNPR
jgi:hypothetical protein